MPSREYPTPASALCATWFLGVDTSAGFCGRYWVSRTGRAQRQQQHPGYAGQSSSRTRPRAHSITATQGSCGSLAVKCASYSCVGSWDRSRLHAGASLAQQRSHAALRLSDSRSRELLAEAAHDPEPTRNGASGRRIARSSSIAVWSRSASISQKLLVRNRFGA
jgi:hypothetical protein